MHLPLRLDGHTIRDADGRVIVSAINTISLYERRQIVKGVNALMADPARILGTCGRSGPHATSASARTKAFWEA